MQEPASPMPNQINKKILTSTLAPWIPHRPPMIWIDEVISFGPKGGECLVHLKSDAGYLTRGKLRPSSLFEFVAQAQAFVGICCAMEQGSAEVAFREAFLVAVTDANLEDWRDFKDAEPGTTLTVKVSAPRSLGPINIFSGSVWTSDNICIGSTKMKAFVNRASTANSP